MNVKCQTCRKEIYRSKRDFLNNKSGKFFCSPECRSKHVQLLSLVVCIVCGKEFSKNISEQRRYPNHCCSIECRSVLNNKIQALNCDWCGEDIFRPPSLIRGKSNLFCSQNCNHNFQTTKKTIKCDRCGNLFQQHLCIISRTRHGKNFCSTECSSKYRYSQSLVEFDFETLIKDTGIIYDRNNRSVIHPLELDFWFPEIKFALEINGPSHYKPIYGESSLRNQKIRDSRKRKMCKQMGIKLRVVKICDSKRDAYLSKYKRIIWEIMQIYKNIS